VIFGPSSEASRVARALVVRALLSLVLVVLSIFGPRTARATDDADTTLGGETTARELNAAAVKVDDTRGVAPRTLSTYERESLTTALARRGTELEPHPDGKRVEGVDVVVLEVFEERDPAPAFLNWFHVNTLESVVRREILLRPGQDYRQVLAAESERNLRRFAQFSVVLVTATKGSDPESVRILVVTKDVWSLRVSWDPTFANGKLTGLTLAPAEWNLFGTTQALSGNLFLGVNTFWVGGAYRVPRVAGSRIAAEVGASVQMNCQTGQAEGGRFFFSYGQPLYSLRTPWAWGVSADYVSQVSRAGFGTANAVCSSPGASGVRVALEPARGSALTRVAYIPNIYRNEVFAGDIGITRSFFVHNKVNVSFGLEAERVQNTPLATSSDVYVGESWYSPSASNRTCWPPTEACPLSTPQDAVLTDEIDVNYVRARYAEQRLGPGSYRIGPYVKLSAYETNYIRVLNFNTLGLQEDVQLGHSVSLKAYPGVRPLASRNAFGTVTSISYALPVLGGVYRLSASSTLELSGRQDDLAPEGARRSSLSDAKVEFQSHLVTPDIGFGRFVVGTAYGEHTQWRRVAPLYELGSMDRLRGHPATAFIGRTLFVNNTEFRTRPLEVLSTLIGGVAFWDVGGAADGARELPFAHGVGLGLRVLLPQIDRQVFRIDVGMPIQADPLAALTVTAGFKQVFGDN
jgi:hypothetical protein